MDHSTKKLDQQIAQAIQKVDIGGVYYHYKNSEKFYVVESVGFLEATEEVCVVYRALYDKGIVWVRTLENFIEKIGDTSRFVKVS
ncbi:hypothetical protein A2801_04420 [Candidatus Woesebacteria bacterium RIFCSPHIGHO2_01_FULL_41_10]|uniref:DUF1653 domain-containing protein n=1 Tax=Candidatus Woesebacteria bacterium RIFCSPHIGHO2_01_FULL_41_10 TaxID=1802500 RepID=A0A1F7YM32_9BACT|nr:MAG: hypothetical protein A2801_04420 [Candidatus Woesebacteria bacterium RIFCSPHIGHO2_01_FULL_41_10]